MCGIVGYVGHREAVSFLLSGLRRRPEYRGYDSPGIASICETSLDVRKVTGKIANLETLLIFDRPKGSVGIGHTRWATHGVRRMPTPILTCTAVLSSPSSTTGSSKTVESFERPWPSRAIDFVSKPIPK